MSIIGISCYDMVVQHGYTDPTIIPEPVQSIKGQNKVYRLEHSTGTSAFKINRAFNIRCAETTTSTPTPATPSAKAILPKTTKRQLFKTTDEPVGESKKQKGD